MDCCCLSTVSGVCSQLLRSWDCILMNLDRRLQSLDWWTGLVDSHHKLFLYFPMRLTYRPIGLHGCITLTNKHAAAASLHRSIWCQTLYIVIFDGNSHCVTGFISKNCQGKGGAKLQVTNFWGWNNLCCWSSQAGYFLMLKFGSP